MASWKRIDACNIREASKFAMKMALSNLKCKPDVILVDGNMDIGWSDNTFYVIKGDGKSFAIGAASIVAKVVRDRLMARYHKIFPNYAFHRHKGYPTKLHREMLRKYGVSPIHRMSFNLGI